MPKEAYSGKTTWEAMQNIKGRSIEEMRTHIMQRTVKASTLENYRSEARKLLNWVFLMDTMEKDDQGRFGASKLKEEEIIERKPEGNMEEMGWLGNHFTMEHYISFLYAHMRSHPLSFRRIRATLILAQKVAGVPHWGGEQVCINMEKAALAATENNNSRRGTIEENAISAFFNLVEENNRNIFVGMMVQMGACLRITELTRLTKRDIKPEGVMIVQGKRSTVAKTKSSRIQAEMKNIKEWTDGKDAWDILKKLAENAKSEEEYLFPRETFTIKDYNAMVKRAAKELEWPDNLKFDGSHVLRHAGVRRAVKDLEGKGKSLEEMSKVLLMSKSMIIHYARSNQERVQGKNKAACIKEDVIGDHIEDSEDEEQRNRQKGNEEGEEGESNEDDREPNVRMKVKISRKGKRKKRNRNYSASEYNEPGMGFRDPEETRKRREDRLNRKMRGP